MGFFVVNYKKDIFIIKEKRMLAGARIPKKVVSRLSMAIFVMFISWQIAGSVLLVLLDGILQASNDVEYNLLSNIINGTALYVIALPLVLLVIKSIPEKRMGEPYQPRLKVTVSKFLAMVVLCFGTIYVTNFISNSVFGLNNFSMQIFANTANKQWGSLNLLSNEFATNLFFSVCMPAVMEEFVFRYLIYKKMRGSGDLLYILFSGFSFGMFHGNFAQMFYAVAIGCIFAWIYAKTNNIWLPVVLHFINNLCAFFLFPYLMGTGIGLLLLLLFVLGAMIYAIVVFIKWRKNLWAGLSPPSEPGWPKAKEKRWQLEERCYLPFETYEFNQKLMAFPPYSENKMQNYQAAMYMVQQETAERQIYEPYYPVWISPYTGAYFENEKIKQSQAVWAAMNGVKKLPHTYEYIGTAKSGAIIPASPWDKMQTVPGFLLKNVGSILFVSITMLTAILYMFATMLM